jgi:RimJ/RimL family protein N-acetyltransferase
MSGHQLFFQLGATSSRKPAPLSLPPANYDSECWKPRGWELKPRPLPTLPFSLWGLFHHLRFFPNRDYTLQLVTYRGACVHRSCAFPPYFRFPFMAVDDLQIGDIWTEEAHRGRGLALYAVTALVCSLQRPGRTFWYLCDEDNTASARVATKACFQLVGEGVRTKRMGSRLFGSFQITPSSFKNTLGPE